jgi:signal transduction histidine kinase/CheY-like chemotaxis protein
VFSLLAAWAVAFGCAVGWDAVVLPGTSFLPKAGPLGSAIGLLLGGLAMAVVAWNYHCMIRRFPGPGGVYTYATEAFGGDHGFVCAWFLCLTYIAIVWADATVTVSIARWLWGDFLRFGFLYTVADMEVSLGYILFSGIVLFLAAAVCLRRRLSARVQTALALLLAACILLCFCTVAARRPDGGLSAMGPAFSPAAGGESPFVQVFHVLALSPWLFVGFEAISNLSGEFRFPLRHSFAVMAWALAASVAAYLLFTAIPVILPLGGAASWPEGLASVGDARFPAFDSAVRGLGRAGPVVLGLMMLGAVFTNLIGNTLAAGRMVEAMAADGVLPRWFAGTAADGSPKNAVLAIAFVSLAVAALGRTVIGIIADLAVIGAGVAYAYTSAATFKFARGPGARWSRVTGIAGLVFAAAVSIAFVLPNVSADTASMATPSYLVVVLWCLAGLLSFLHVFRNDRERRFGRSTVVWLSLLAVILFMTGLWIRQRTYETTDKAYRDIIAHHAAMHVADGTAAGNDEWVAILRDQLSYANRSIVRNSLVQVGIAVLSFGLMFCLYAILRRRERELEREKARAKSYFFSTVSHDIRTPLNAIIGFSEMLKAGFETEAERRQALDAIVVSGKTLLGLVNDVLDLSKLESGKMEINPEPTDCHRLLHGVVDAFRVSGSKPGVELRCHVGEMPPLVLDPQRLRQIVFNIVGNAVKFTEKGYVEVRAAYVRKEAAATGTFRLEVEDTGCGITAEDLRHVGSAYVQLGAKVSRNGGTGLGLAICKQLAAAMGGRLGAESELGCGSTFWVELPGVMAAEVPAHAEDAPGEEGAAPAAAKHHSAATRILIVDDSKMNLMVLKAHLKHIGNFDCAMAADGRAALDILEAPGVKPFDLVLTDMWMPVMDGFELFKAIRANPALAGLRVVIVTADVELQAQAEQMGFDGILLKPVTAAQLARLVAAE